MIVGTMLWLGDSIFFGARSPRAAPDFIPPMLTARSNGTIWASLNRSVCGETVWQILQRTPGAVRELDGMFGAKWCVILAGTNDAKAGGRGPEGLADWSALYQQILHWPLRYRIPTVLCTFPPVSPEMPDFGGGAGEWLRQASEFVRDLVQNYNEAASTSEPPTRVVLCDLERYLSPKHLADGVHLTREGYLEVAQLVADTVLPPESPCPILP